MPILSILIAFICTIDFLLAFILTVYIASERKKLARQHIVFYVVLIALFMANIGLILYH